MGDIILLVIWLGLPAIMLLLALTVGNWITARHEADLARRQPAVAHIRTTDLRVLMDAVPGARPPMLLTSEVTMGIDHFRGFLGKLKNIFGGEVRSYQAALDRARREVVMRLLEQAHALGYNALANLRIDFADISGNATRVKKASAVSILASATAHYASTTADMHMESPVAAAAAGG